MRKQERAEVTEGPERDWAKFALNLPQASGKKDIQQLSQVAEWEGERLFLTENLSGLLNPLKCF